MQPIKTTNAMNPAPAKGIESFPTPVIDDVVIAEVVNAWKGDYQPLEYGTLWKDVSHAPNQGSFPEHKLVFQQPTSEDGQWIKRIWVNDRVNQDSYNYAIKYSAGSQQHPIYIRNYVVPRETYTPLPDGTPDPLFPIALLVDEEANRIEGELDSKYVSVTRVYETLPGPEVPTKRYNERGDLETVIVQTVPPFTPPDPDGLLVTQSQVVQEEMGKGVKTTATVQDHALLQIKEKKEGLLGETITTDDIVSPSTNPDALSQTVVSSTVEQFSATKARKRTTTASGPTSLTQKSNDGKLLGNVTSTQSIVAPTVNPDSVSSAILSSEVKQVDSGKAIKTNVVLNSTPTLNGSQNEKGLLGNNLVVESIVAAGTLADQLSKTIVSSSVEAIDSVRSKKTTITSIGPTTLSGVQNEKGLLGQTQVTETIVDANSPADPVSLQVLSSIVESIDSAKSKKTTITSSGPTVLNGKENKAGLLGNTIITESIVPANSPPDELSISVIQSTVEPIDSAKSKKITIASEGPYQFQSNVLTSSPTGLVEAIKYKTIYDAKNYFPAGGLYTVSHNSEQIDENKIEVEAVGVANWPEVNGIKYDETIGVPIKYTEQVVSPYTAGNWQDYSNTEFTPIDQWKSLKKTFNKNEIVEALLSQYYVIQTQEQIELPDKLIGIKVYWSLDKGIATGNDNAPQVDGDSYSYSVSYSRRSTASASGDIYFKIEKGFSGAIPAKQHIFFMEISKDGKVNKSVIDDLNERSGEGYLRWPQIKRTTENLVLVGGSKSKTESWTKAETVSINGFSSVDRKDDSFDIDRSANTVNVPDTIHTALTIESEKIGDFAGIDYAPEYGVYPSLLNATSISKFPTGKYLLSANMELYKWGLVKVNAITIDITNEYT